MSIEGDIQSAADKAESAYAALKRVERTAADDGGQVVMWPDIAAEIAAARAAAAEIITTLAEDSLTGVD